MTQPTKDPVIDEIREIRHRVSAECNHDTALYVARLKSIEEQHRERCLRAEASKLRTPREAS